MDGYDASGARLLAPVPLRLVQAFVNTRDIEAGVDELATATGLGAWLDHVGLPGSDRVDAGQLDRAVELREAFRAALEANAHVASGDPSARLTSAAAGIPLHVEGSPLGPRVMPAGRDLAAALGTLLAIAAAAVADGSWVRLKVCRNDACRWAYWDGSRNRSGVWCTMAVCGNRMKGRSFRRRRSGSEGDSAGRS
jgi:predicted RNA-binding Zn ribbon-like protein